MDADRLVEKFQQQPERVDVSQRGEANFYDFKVSIKGPNDTSVVFDASVSVSESRTVNYDNYAITHLPADIWAYRNTTSRMWTVTGKLISRNKEEAERNSGQLSTLRSWTLPGFGKTGSTPPILRFKAYNSLDINNVTCVVRQYSWTYGDDVDYVYTAFEKMPVIGTIQVDLVEVYSAEEITKGAWRISPGNGGSLAAGGANRIDGLNYSDPKGTVVSGIGTGPVLLATPNIALFGAGGSFPGLASLPGLQSAGDLLGQAGRVISAIPSMAQRYGIQLSPQLSEVTSQIPQITNNPYITGLPPQALQQLTTVATTAASNAARSLDAFGRTVDLSAPNFVSGD